MNKEKNLFSVRKKFRPAQHMLKGDVAVAQVVPSANVYNQEQSGPHSS